MTYQEIAIITTDPHCILLYDEIYKARQLGLTETVKVCALSKELRERVNMLKHIDADTPIEGRETTV